eukprot:SAG11_NODE_1222_length_5484_cov_7.843268_6_plen_163_part_00
MDWLNAVGWLQVGGKDGARIKGFLNTAMWLQAGLLSVSSPDMSPDAGLIHSGWPLSVLQACVVRLRAATKSWGAIFMVAPVLQVLTTMAFCRYSTDETYRAYRKRVGEHGVTSVGPEADGVKSERAHDDWHGRTAELRRLKREAAQRANALRQVRQMRACVT